MKRGRVTSVSLRMTPEFETALDKAAAAYGLSRSAFIRFAIGVYLRGVNNG